MHESLSALPLSSLPSCSTNPRISPEITNIRSIPSASSRNLSKHWESPSTRGFYHGDFTTKHPPQQYNHQQPCYTKP
ncbi:uncharacterized protein BO97DRAFT_404885 [Aspergillus homomorphus CBS 101889]|uniref:Uncharacterized protein n=1 Tax=Aspergillus homomorphus (strain CBS 101889) TaxID=1450537 RepID=A0A395HZL2_ASPHC|nr:hypothetical protein BO97DRAFT_404885 [Aspergillus homomorphus CBS 101889]RAL13382.1 hypothetical protein BO97DRAFT_404885 [Aspergillus homomorphus CBS 101889]